MKVTWNCWGERQRWERVREGQSMTSREKRSLFFQKMNHRETAQREDWFSWPGTEQGKDCSVLPGVSMHIMLNILWIRSLAFTGKKVDSGRERERELSHSACKLLSIGLRLSHEGVVIRSSCFHGPGPGTTQTQAATLQGHLPLLFSSYPLRFWN